jgi:Ser/Thr protein kinase RdoA (MazF antagonist)
MRMSLNADETGDLLANWSLVPLRCERSRGGHINDNLFVETASGRYVLRRLTRFKKLAGLRLELDQLRYLKERGFGYEVPSPVANSRGGYFVKYKGGYYWLYPYIEGKIRKRISRGGLRQVARMMAEYHSLIRGSRFASKSGMRDPFFKRAILRRAAEARSSILAERKPDPSDKAFLRELDVLVPLLKGLIPDGYRRLRTYSLHCDFTPENLIWKGDRLVGAIDFDAVGWSEETMACDVAMSLWSCCATGRNRSRLDLGKASLFVKEYGKRESLSDTEISFIPQMIAARVIDFFVFTRWLPANGPGRARVSDLRERSANAQWYLANRERIVKRLLAARRVPREY